MPGSLTDIGRFATCTYDFVHDAASLNLSTGGFREGRVVDNFLSVMIIEHGA